MIRIEFTKNQFHYKHVFFFLDDLSLNAADFYADLEFDLD